MIDEQDKVLDLHVNDADEPNENGKKLSIESFIQHSADAIWMVDLDERVLHINPAFEALFGWAEKEVVGRRLPTTPYFLKAETNQVLQQVKLGHPKVGYETQRLCKDGRLLHVSATLSPVRNQQGDVVGISGRCRDISHIKRSEEEQRKTRERLEAFIQNSRDAIWMIDLEGRVLQVNPAFEALFGWAEEDVLGKRLPIIPDFLAVEMQWLHQQIKAGQSKRGYETQRICFDGRLIHVSATLSPVRNNQGEVIGISGTCRDISHLKRSEEELRKTKERLEAIIHNSADAIWLIDLQDRVLQINPAFEELFGWSEADVVGKHLPIIPDDLSDEIHRLHEQIKAGHSKRGYETQRVCKDGRLIYVSATLSPVRNNRGEVIGVSGTCRDISHIKRSEEELRKTKERLEAFIQSSADAIWMVDMEGRVQQINPAFEELFGWTQADVLGKPLPIIPDSHSKQMEQLHEQIKRGHRLSGYETQRQCKDGRLIYVSATLSPVRNNQGEVIGISGTCRDLSQNKQSEELLIQTEKLSIAGQLAAGLAHEIRNPLTALKGFVQLMQVGQETHRKYLEVMESELSRIEMIVSELLVLAKPQANSFKRMDLVSILRDVLTLSETQAILHNVQIRSEFLEELPEVDCDHNQLKQVFINFIKNAIEAMPDGGMIHISADLLADNEQPQIRIRVQDEGTGIPQEHLAHLGEPFYTTKTKGTGLGLMVSKKIIEGHRGRLEITSEVGMGTTVDVYLPLPN